MKKLLLLFLFLNSILYAQEPVKFAAFGDYGVDDLNELAVSLLVKSWNPEFIVTTGDNNYWIDRGDSIDHKIGRYYQEFIKPYMGNYGSGSPTINRFFPALGNHDLYDGLYYGPNDIRYTGYYHYNYFKLTDPVVVKGNTPDVWSPLGVRYYTFIKGNIQFFIANTGLWPQNHAPYWYSEPDGIDSSSVQAQWIKTQLNNSTATWKIVVLHHPPYYSGEGDLNVYRTLQWNFKQWGANLVLAGHIHNYERLNIEGLTYVTSGLGGAKKNSPPLPPQRQGSITLYTSQYGANLFQVYNDSLVGKFINIDNEIIDDFKLVTGQTVSTDAGVSDANVTNPGTIYTGGNYCVLRKANSAKLSSGARQ